MTARNGFLRRQTNNPGGIAAGGADTGFDIQPQKTLLMKRVSQSVQDVILPKGTVLFSTVVMPDPDTPASAGTVSIDIWDISDNTSDDVVVEEADATVYTEAIATTVKDDGEETPAIIGLSVSATILAADTRYRITPDSIPAGKAALAGFMVILPRMRI